MNIIITNDEINNISYQLKQIYYAVEIEQEYQLTNNTIIDMISEVIEHNNELLQQFIEMNPESSYSVNFNEELVRAFFDKIENILQDVNNVVYKFNVMFQNTSDIMAIIVPYILGKMCVTNDEMLLFVGLAIEISKIVISSFANKQEKNDEKVIVDELKNICLTNLEVLKNVSETKEVQKYIEQINEIIEKLKND